jgi:hypothetical protein
MTRRLAVVVCSLALAGAMGLMAQPTLAHTGAPVPPGHTGAPVPPGHTGAPVPPGHTGAPVPPGFTGLAR